MRGRIRKILKTTRSAIFSIWSFIAYLARAILVILWNIIAIPIGATLALFQRASPGNAMRIFYAAIAIAVFFYYRSEIGNSGIFSFGSQAGSWFLENIDEAVIPAILVFVTALYTIYTKRLADLQREATKQLAEQARLPFMPRILLRKKEFRFNKTKEEFTLSLELENVGQGDAPEFKVRFHYREVKDDKEDHVNRSVAKSDGPFQSGETRMLLVDFPSYIVENNYNNYQTMGGLIAFCNVRMFYRDVLGNAYYDLISISISKGGSDDWWDGLNISRVDLHEAWRFSEKQFVETGSIEDIRSITSVGAVEPYYHARYESSFVRAKKMARLGRDISRFTKRLPKLNARDQQKNR